MVSSRFSSPTQECDFSHGSRAHRSLSLSACVRFAPLPRSLRTRGAKTMTGVHRLACQMATLLLLLTLTTLPAKAQFGGFGGSGGGGSGGGGDMMTQMAPMLEMMKAKMGKRRFAAMMQTMGPMMSRMMENGGGFGGGGIPGGFGGGDVTSMLGSS